MLCFCVGGKLGFRNGYDAAKDEAAHEVSMFHDSKRDGSAKLALRDIYCSDLNGLEQSIRELK